MKESDWRLMTSMSLKKATLEKTKNDNYRTNKAKTQAQLANHLHDQKYHGQVAEVQKNADLQRELYEQELRKKKAYDNAVLLKK